MAGTDGRLYGEVGHHLHAAARTWTVFRQQIVFYPLLFIATAVLLFLATSATDRSISGLPRGLTSGFTGLLVFGGGGNPARSVLTTIAGSWATILGVVFSMTMIVLQLASTAFTSEVVSRIKRATITQVTLGCFVGVVTYSLLLLKVVRDSSPPRQAFVPVIGVNVAIVWAIVSIILVVLFLGFLSNQIQAGTLIGGIVDDATRELHRRSAALCDLNDGKCGPVGSAQQSSVFHATAASDGYVRFIDWRLLVQVLRHVLETSETRVTIIFQCTIGDSVVRGASVARICVWPENEQVGRSVAAWVKTALEISNQRGADRDPAYAVEQLTAIGLKVLQRGDVDIADRVLHGLTTLYGSVAHAASPARFTVQGARGVAAIDARIPDVRRLIAHGLGHLMTKVVQQQDGTVVETFFSASGALLDRLVRECGEEDLTILLDTLRTTFQRLLEAPYLAPEVLRGVSKWMNALCDEASNGRAAASCLAHFLASCRQDAEGHPDLQRALTHP